MVEFALIAPILFLLIVGIYEFSLAYSAKVEITGAAREGARAVALRQTSPTVPTAPTLTQVVRNAAPGVSPAPTVTLNHACPATPAVGENAEITVRYTFTYSIPFYGEGTWPMSVKGVMRCGI
jgi:Flp pilus assembly protein TadG